MRFRGLGFDLSPHPTKLNRQITELHASIYVFTLNILKLRASWLYRRGMVRAKIHQHVLAIEDYTAVIEMTDAPAGIKAMALYNRALVYSDSDRDAKSIEDLEKVLTMAGAAGRVRVEAKRKLVRMKRNLHRAEAQGQNAQSSSQGGSHAGIKSKESGKHPN